MSASLNPLARTSHTATPNHGRAGWLLINRRDVCQYHFTHVPEGETLVLWDGQMLRLPEPGSRDNRRDSGAPQPCWTCGALLLNFCQSLPSYLQTGAIRLQHRVIVESYRLMQVNMLDAHRSSPSLPTLTIRLVYKSPSLCCPPPRPGSTHYSDCSVLVHWCLCFQLCFLPSSLYPVASLGSS